MRFFNTENSFIAVIAWGLTAGTASQGAELSDPTLTVETVVEAWRSRQLKVHSVQFEWKHDGSHLNFLGLSPSEGKANQYLLTASLRMDSIRLRYDGKHSSNWVGRQRDSSNLDSLSMQLEISYNYNHFQTDFEKARKSQFQIPEDHKRQPRRFTCLFDGEVYRHLFGVTDHLSPVGFIVAPENYEEINDIYFRPILLAYRPLHPHLGRVHSENCRLDTDQFFVNGWKCAVLHETQSNGRTVSYWIDPAREFVVVRCIEKQNGKSLTQLDISYQRDRKYGWVPSSWTTIYSGLKYPFHSASTLVTNYVFNEPTEPNVFELTFPHGTLLIDTIKGKNYALDNEGIKREIETRHEMWNMLRSGRQQDRLWNLTSTQWYLVVFAIVCSVLAILMRAIRSFQKRKQSLDV